MSRTVLWASICTVALYLFAVSAIVVAALSPKPGANMVLMGLPILALPTCFFGATAAAAANYGVGLTQWERRIGYAVGVASVLVFVPMVVLG